MKIMVFNDTKTVITVVDDADLPYLVNLLSATGLTMIPLHESSTAEPGVYDEVPDDVVVQRDVQIVAKPLEIKPRAAKRILRNLDVSRLRADHRAALFAELGVEDFDLDNKKAGS